MITVSEDSVDFDGDDKTPSEDSFEDVGERPVTFAFDPSHRRNSLKYFESKQNVPTKIGKQVYRSLTVRS